MDMSRNKTKYDMTVLLELCLPTNIQSKNGSDQDSVTSTVNSKMILLGVEHATTRLIVCFSQPNANYERLIMPNLYNDLWDCAMTAGKFHLDTIVLSGNAMDIIHRVKGITKILNAGPDIDLKATVENDIVKSKKIDIVNLGSQLQEETNGVSYVLYDNNNQPLPLFRKVATGGTFDHFHNGHKKLLSICSAVTKEELIVGVTGDSMLGNKKLKDLIEDVDTRCQYVRDYLGMHGREDLFVNISILTNVWGPTVDVPDVEGLVCSTETLKGARLINEERARRGMGPLQVVAVSRSNAYVLSSTFMRQLVSNERTNT